MSHFATLYNLAHRMLTAPRESTLGKLSRHSGKSDTDANETLQQAICQATMPGEQGDTPWGVVRVFMRNLVNRAYAPISGAEMVELLAMVEVDTDAGQFGQRMEMLAERVAQRSTRLADSVATLRTVEPVRGQNYIEWLMQRTSYYASLPIDQLDPEQVLTDVCVIAVDSETKIPNIGVALAANLLADLGAPAFAKPDKHVLLTILALMPAGSRPDPKSCIKKVIEVAKLESPVLARDADYQKWLQGGLQPRHFDRLIYLIGSDNFLLNGIQDKRCAPIRRQLMCAALTGSDGGLDEVTPTEPVAPQSPGDHGGRIRADVNLEKKKGDDGGALNVNAELKFYDRLEGDETAQSFLDGLIELAATESCEVHYTFTANADIRIRAFRHKTKPVKQNVVVLTWLPTKRGFACQLFAQTETCRGLGLLTAEPQPRSTSPLPTKVFLDPRDQTQVKAFGLAASQSILDFCDGQPSPKS